MKCITLLLALASTTPAVTPVMVFAQTPAAPTAKTATAKTAGSTTTGAAAKTATHTAATSAVKLPPGVPPVRGLVKTAFALRYQDISIGTGAVAEPLKLYKVAYTGWLAADGKKFDSSFDHPDKQPIQFPQGRGRVIPGWDQAFEGMKIGGKRRLFIPYELAYGALGRPPVIPAKSDLIFDVELIDVTDMPAAPQPVAPAARPMPGAGVVPPGGNPSARPATPGAPAAPATPGSTAAPAKPADPTAPTVSPNSSSPNLAPAPAAQPATPPTTQSNAPAQKPTQ